MKTIPQVLVIDDNALSRSLISYYLRNLGCQVFEVENGEECLKEIRTHKFDLIVLDWNMPKLNGYQTLIQGDELLKRKNLEDSKLPVMIYTNLHLQELDIPSCDHFSVRATLSKRLTPFQQQKRIKQTLAHLF